MWLKLLNCSFWWPRPTFKVEFNFFCVFIGAWFLIRMTSRVMLNCSTWWPWRPWFIVSYIQPIRLTVGVYTQCTVNVDQVTQFTQVLNLVTLTYFQGQVLKRSEDGVIAQLPNLLNLFLLLLNISHICWHSRRFRPWPICL